MSAAHLATFSLHCDGVKANTAIAAAITPTKSPTKSLDGAFTESYLRAKITLKAEKQ